MNSAWSVELVWWWMLFLLPLPLLVYKLIPKVEEKVAIRLPYLPKSDAFQGSRFKLQTQFILKILLILIWLLLVIATTRPVWYGEPMTFQTKHRDLLLVVDLSYSMSQQDMKEGSKYIDRLTAIKKVLNDFIEKRQGDRLGLVLFADHAYLQTPLTLDRETIKQQLNQVVLKLIGTKTAIGDGLGLATKTFIDSDAPQRVMILLSDGSNTAGVLDPIEAANIAKKYDTTIYTIGVGAGEIKVKDFFGERTVNTAADLDEKTLSQIAEITGGQYFRARDSQDLNNIYHEIDQLEPIANATQTWRPQHEWFYYPLSIAFMLSVVFVILRKRNG